MNFKYLTITIQIVSYLKVNKNKIWFYTDCFELLTQAYCKFSHDRHVILFLFSL